MKIPTALAWPFSALPEAPASLRASAPCYCRTKNIFIVAVVVPELKFRDVQRQIFRADFVECDDDPTLDDRPEALNRLGVDSADNVFTLGVVNDPVRELFVEVLIANPFVGADEANVGRNAFVDKGLKGFGADVRDDTGHDVAFAADGTCDDCLSRTAGPFRAVEAVVLVPVLGFAADDGLVNFDNAHELLKFLIHKRRADAMRHRPSRFQRPKTHVAVKLARADPLLACEHEMDDAEPIPQVLVDVLEDRAGNVGKAVSAADTAIRALPMPLARRQRVNPCRAAARATSPKKNQKTPVL